MQGTVINTENLLTTKQAARLVGRSRAMIYRLITDGDVATFTLGDSTYVIKESLIEEALRRGWIKERG